MAIRTAIVNVRIEPAVKKEAAEIFTESGMSFSDAINAFCKETIRRQAIPFRFTARKKNPVDVSHMTKEELLADLEEAAKGPSRPFSEAMAEFEKAHGINEV